jgi:uncharacterized protein (DUF486 family)
LPVCISRGKSKEEAIINVRAAIEGTSSCCGKTTFVWYGHLKYRNVALWKVVVASWGIAFFEYCFQVPANRIGSYEFNPAQLKTIQEVITLSVFSVFSILYLGEPMKWNYLVGFGFITFITLAAFFIFHQW